ncbi:MAG: Mrp/NBP35 family ATP-binding protein [Clostridia bacterium]|nr:Mrp/NBP35 family ATP-binding protein [Clostridia bacterium]
MSEECTHNCETCSANCGERTKESFLEKPNELSSIKKVIGVVSGKGGVGKSLITSLLSISMQRKGLHSAILDADITGPSIPKAFGLKEKAEGTETALLPVKTKTGIDVMSLNLLLENESDPVVWRGPVIGGVVKQFWTDVIWTDVDYMFVDMPPGTGDVPLTVFQSIPVDGIVVVTSPQELVTMIVEKAVNMAKMMDIPVLGLVENMSYFECPDCGKRHSIYGESHLEEVAKSFGIDNIARIPIDPKVAAACDKGMIELCNGDWLEELSDAIEQKLK